MPGEEAAAASAAVSDLPGAGAGILSGTDRAADGGNETLSLVSGAGVSASGDGDGGRGRGRGGPGATAGPRACFDSDF